MATLPTTSQLTGSIITEIDFQNGLIQLLSFIGDLLDTDGTTASARTKLGVQQLDPTLTALAGVVTAADKLIYSTAPDTFSTTTITNVARNLLDDTSTSAMLATLGGAQSGINSDITALTGLTVPLVQLASDQSWTGSQRGTIVAENDLSIDLNASNNFTCTTSTTSTLTFTNMTAGQSGWIKFVISGTPTISAHANTLISSANLTRLNTAGTYVGSYFCDGTNVYISLGVFV
jgi:hypothetical protein